jgi:polar amino acid transport system substrate-binding protein
MAMRLTASSSRVHPIGTRLLLISLLLSGSAFALDPAKDFAPTGTLRATFLGTNPVQARTDPKTGELTGPIVDLTKEFAKKLGVPYKIGPSPDARGVMDALKNGTADIGFLAYDAPRAKEVDYAGPFEVMLNSYVVAADSKIRKSADIEKPGVVVAAVKGQTQEIYLSEHLKKAKMHITATQPPLPEMEKMLASGEVHAFAMNRQRALEAGAASSKVRALPDSFLAVDQEFVLSKGSDKAKLDYIAKFVAELRKSGFVKESIERAKLTGVEVAKGK